MSTRWYSLRRRLLGLLLGGISAAWLATAVFSYFDAHREVDELFDAQLAQVAQTLLALASTEKPAHVAQIGPVAHRYQRHLHFQIWQADGQLLFRSDNAPETPLTHADGFTEIEGGGEHWRLFSQWNPDRTLQVQVSEDHYIRDELIGQIALRLLFPLLVGLPLIGLGVWLATRRGLAALDHLADQIAARHPQQLQAVQPAVAPEEIRTLLEALNGLFQRVDQALDAERRFTADAAHELRTPLAALQAQLQVAERARDDAERNRSLQQIHRGLIRAGHLVDQMLTLARLDPESGLPAPESVDLGLLAEAVCADLGPAILDKNLDFSLEAAPGCLVTGQGEWLRVLLRNLIDNAARYTPAGGRVDVHLAQHDGAVVLHVSDNGPGIPAGQRAAVFQRFHRLAPGGESGSGLGLAIVRRIADLHGADLQLADNDGGGLRVTVIFPGKAATS